MERQAMILNLFIEEVIITDLNDKLLPSPPKLDSEERIFETIEMVCVPAITEGLEDDEGLVQIPHQHSLPILVLCHSL